MQENHTNKNSILSMMLDENVESIDKDFNNPEIAKYLDELCSLGASQLKGQLKILDKEEQDLKNSIKQITLKNIPSIISTSNFVNNLDLNDLNKNINTYQDNLPIFTAKVNLFSEEAKNISKRWRDASLMLNKHSKILEFLEIIQLLDSCLRNAHYDEALQLLNYISKLNVKHGKNIPLIADLANKSIEWKETMMNYLLKELYSNDDITSYSTSIEYLRKLEEFDESEIKLKFLLAKNYKLQNQIKELDHKNIGNYLKQSIQIYERMILNTYDQYNKIFNDEINLKQLTLFKQKMNKFDLDFNDSSMLFSWIILKLNNLINELKLGLSHLINEDQQFFKHLLLIKELCDKFSRSLFKIGLNYQNHFDQLFNEYLEQDLKLNFNKLIKRFEHALDSYNISSHNDLIDETINESNKIDNQLELTPPKSIKQFTPLKQLCNDLIRLFDKLVLFTATSDLIFKFKLILEDNLKQTSIIIEKYIRSELSSLQKVNEQQLLTNFKDVYKYSLITHLQTCYKSIIKSFNSIDLLGIPNIEFSNIKINDNEIINYNELDLNKIYFNL